MFQIHDEYKLPLGGRPNVQSQSPGAIQNRPQVTSWPLSQFSTPGCPYSNILKLFIENGVQQSLKSMISSIGQLLHPIINRNTLTIPESPSFLRKNAPYTIILPLQRSSSISYVVPGALWFATPVSRIPTVGKIPLNQ